MDRVTGSMLSLCQRAGKLVTGEDTVEISIRKGGVYLVIIASDASDNTRTKFINKCRHYNIPYYVFSYKAELSRATGRFNRTVFGIADENFASKLSALLGAQSVDR